MSEIPTVTITMVGPRGVGKTSLLAAMYNELDAELTSIGCNLSLDAGPTTQNIAERLKELKSSANGTGIKIQAGEGISSSSESREYTFHLHIGDGGLPEVSLRFIDLPGGWYTGEGDYKKADQLLGESHVSILAVDATALMEASSKECGGLGKYHEDINAFVCIRQAYKRALNNFKDGHIIIIALIRAETYVKSGKIDLLYKRLSDAYGALVADLKFKDKKIPVLACYVETLGSLVFNSFSEENGSVIAQFRRIPGMGYKPERCAIPLRIAAGWGLVAALDQALIDFNGKNIWWRQLLGRIGIDKALSQARAKYARTYQVFEKLRESIKEDDFIEL